MRVRWTGAGLVTVLVATIIGIALAPLGLIWIAQLHRGWVTLGNVGQAYGGISALISAIALVGIAGSLLLQSRQHSLDRIFYHRSRQAELYAVVREDPELYWSAFGGSLDTAERIFVARPL
jgi:hypothetical protein